MLELVTDCLYALTIGVILSITLGYFTLPLLLIYL